VGAAELEARRVGRGDKCRELTGQGSTEPNASPTEA
jgi:hypothetical protein